MDNLSHLAGAIWEEFKSLNYSNEQIDDYIEILNELSSLYELCKEHFGYFFKLPKTEYLLYRISQSTLNNLKTCEYIQTEIGIEIITKEIIHFKSLIEKLKAILLMPKDKGVRYLQNHFLPPKNPRVLRILTKIEALGYTSSLSVSSIDTFLSSRYDSNL